MKKVIVLLLCLFLVFSFAACGGESYDDAVLRNRISQLEQELEQLSSYDDTALTALIEQLRQEIAELKQANSRTQVALTSSNWQNYLNVSYQFEDYAFQLMTFSTPAFLLTVSVKVVISRKGNYNFENASITLNPNMVTLGWIRADDFYSLRKTITISFDGNGQTTFNYYHYIPMSESNYHLVYLPDITDLQPIIGTIAGTVSVPKT